MKRKRTLLALAALGGLTLGGVAGAADISPNDALADGPVAIDLSGAVQRAEQHLGGRATHAELERHDGRLVYAVEVVAGRQVSDVQVDAQDGRVLASAADVADSAEHEAQDD